MYEFAKHTTNFGLKLDFNQIIEDFNLTGNYVLQHWQAAPFKLRHFGYLAVAHGVSRYLTIPHPGCQIQVFPETVQLDESKYSSQLRPTAVLLYPNAVLVRSSNGWLIRPVLKELSGE